MGRGQGNPKMDKIVQDLLKRYEVLIKHDLPYRIQLDWNINHRILIKED